MTIPEESPENSGITKLPTRTEIVGQIINFWDSNSSDHYLRFNSGGWIKLDMRKLSIEGLSFDDNEKMERIYWQRVEKGQMGED